MKTYLEHINMTVPDIDAAIEFLKAVAPEFEIRYDGVSKDGYRWTHIGTQESYIALQESHPGSDPERLGRPYKDYGVNHMAWVVKSLDEVTQRLEEKGYRQGIPGENGSHRKRAYYYDSVGFEWEFIEYLTDDPAKRNTYA